MSIFSLFKRNKCFGCESTLNEDFAMLRVKSDGELVEIKICNKCADIWDKSAEVLQKRGKTDDAQPV